MDPLLDLSPLENWSSYEPSMAGYSEAPQEELRKADIKKLFNTLQDLEGDRTVAGHFVIQNAPNPGVIVNGEIVSLPVSATVCARLAECGSKIGETPIHQLDRGKVELSNPAWGKCLKKGVKGATAGMTAKDEPFTYSRNGMVVVASDCSEPYTGVRQVGHRHFATVLVILPSTQTSSVITFETQHKHLTYRKDVKVDQFATQFVAMYSGIDKAIIKVSGGPVCLLTYLILSSNEAGPTLRNLVGRREEIATAFAAWRLARKESRDESREVFPEHILYQLDGDYTKMSKGRYYYITRELSVKHLDHPKDKLVLRHLGPPAKHYNFRILLARIAISLRASCTIANGSDDEGCDDISPDELNLRHDYDGDPEYEWEFTSLDGEPIEATDELEDDLFGEIERGQNIYNYRINLKDETGKESRVDRDGDRENSYFTIRYHKSASFLFIIPDDKKYVGLQDVSPPSSQASSETSTRAPGLRTYEMIEATEDEGRGQKRQRVY